MTDLMREPQAQESAAAEAFCALGRVLLRLVPEGAPRHEAEPVLLALMQALGESSEQGSICARLSSALDDPSRLEPLFACGLACVSESSVGAGGTDNAPLVIDGKGGRFYLQRAFAEEVRLAGRLVGYALQRDEAAAQAIGGKLESLAREDYRRYGGQKSYEAFLEDRRAQDEAVRNAVCRRLSIICGGPGTGKTTTVVRILECLMLGNAGLSVALAAPTGKAASRVLQSVSDAVAAGAQSYPLMRSALAGGRVIERTLHKLLCTPRSDGTRPGRMHPLEADVLVVDEASMMDMPLAVRLFEALDPARTRVIVLGDRHQLAAVGPGSVLADMTEQDGALSELVTRLTVSHRFTADSRVGRLASAVNAGDLNAALGVLEHGSEQGAKDRVARVTARTPGELAAKASAWVREALGAYAERLVRLVREGMPREPDRLEAVRRELWTLFNQSRPIAAQREGAASVASLNREAGLFIRGMLGSALPEGEARRVLALGDFYPGKAVIVRSNSEQLGVYNGDVGIMLPDNAGNFIVYFGDTGKTLPAALLPVHDEAFAITIHQSQGSEYDRVAVFLPAGADSGLAARELLYTGITRARKSVDVFGSTDVFEKAVATATVRDGGLADRLKDAARAQRQERRD